MNKLPLNEHRWRRFTAPALLAALLGAAGCSHPADKPAAPSAGTPSASSNPMQGRQPSAATAPAATSGTSAPTGTGQ